MASEGKITLLIVDDHSILRAGLRLLLNRQPNMEVVGEAGTGEEALGKVKELQPNVVLLDITMPGMSGLEAIRALRKICPSCKVLVLTMHANEEYLFQVLQAGGSGYVLKKAADTELIDAIETVAKGGTFLYPEVVTMLVSDYLHRVKREGARDALDSLTDREREVLRLVAEGYTSSEIAEKLVLSPKTVDAHRSHIMEKLGLHSRAELVKFALRKGILTPEA